MTWADRKLQRNCSTDREGSRHWGAQRWPLLKRRLASLLATPTLADLRNVPGNAHPLTTERHGAWAMSLWGPYRLVFRPTNPVPLLEDGRIDTRSVVSIVVEEIVDYHD